MEYSLSYKIFRSLGTNLKKKKSMTPGTNSKTYFNYLTIISIKLKRRGWIERGKEEENDIWGREKASMVGIIAIIVALGPEHTTNSHCCEIKKFFAHQSCIDNYPLASTVLSLLQLCELN